MATYFSISAQVGIACLLIFVVQRVARAILDPLRNVPGPFLARFSRLWFTSALAKGDFELQNINLHRKYGPVFRVSPGVFSVDDPEAAPIIYRTANALIKSRWYYAAGLPDETLVNLFATDNEKINGEYRRKFLPVLNQFLTYEEHIDTCIKLLSKRLEESASTGNVVDLGWWMTCYAFDFSERFGHLDKGEDVGKVAEGLELRLPYAMHVGVYPKLHPYTFKLVNSLAYVTGQVVNDHALNFLLEKIQEYKLRKERPTGPIDMLTRYVAAHEERPDWFNDYDNLQGAYINIVAGADTTWIALNAVLYNLLKYPKTLEALRHELDKAYETGQISDPITYREAQQLPYLQAVIKEGQRMWPSTGLPLWRIVPKKGVTICARFFPAGTTVGINTWVACHNAEIYAPDPDTFRPERWLQADAEKLARKDRYYIPFGTGPRVCGGKNVALLEMAKVVPHIVKIFDIELDDSLKGDKQWKSENHWLVGQKGFKVKLTPRKVEN